MTEEKIKAAIKAFRSEAHTAHDASPDHPVKFQDMQKLKTAIEHLFETLAKDR